MRREPHRFRCRCLRHTIEFEEHTTGRNLGSKMVWRPFPLTHRDLFTLLGDRRVRENPDPDLAAASDEPGHGTPSGFDLASRNDSAFSRLQAESTKADLVAARRHRANRVIPTLDLAMLHFSGHEVHSRLSLVSKLGFLLFFKLLSLVNPDLHTDHAVSRLRFVTGEINIRAERMKRNLTA